MDTGWGEATRRSQRQRSGLAMTSERAMTASAPGLTTVDRSFWETLSNGIDRIEDIVEKRPQIRPGEKLEVAWTKASVTEGRHYRETAPLSASRAAVRPGTAAEKPAWMRIPATESNAPRRKLQPWDFITTRKVLSQPCIESSQVSFESPSWFHNRYFGKDRVPTGPYRTVGLGRQTMLIPDFEDDPLDTDAKSGDSSPSMGVSSSLPVLPGVGRAVTGGIPGQRPPRDAGRPMRGRRGFTVSSVYGSGTSVSETMRRAAADYEAEASGEPVHWQSRTRGMPPRARLIPRADRPARTKTPASGRPSSSSLPTPGRRSEAHGHDESSSRHSETSSWGRRSGRQSGSSRERTPIAVQTGNSPFGQSVSRPVTAGSAATGVPVSLASPSPVRGAKLSPLDWGQNAVSRERPASVRSGRSSVSRGSARSRASGGPAFSVASSSARSRRSDQGLAFSSQRIRK